jgi:hypothetical protein
MVLKATPAMLTYGLHLKAAIEPSMKPVLD